MLSSNGVSFPMYNYVQCTMYNYYNSVAGCLACCLLMVLVYNVQLCTMYNYYNSVAGCLACCLLMVLVYNVQMYNVQLL